MDDAALLGLELPEIEAEPDFWVDEDNWQTVMTFCQCSTQWHYGAMGGVTGMDYPGVKVVLDLTIKPKQQREVFAGIQIMERAAMAIMNEKASKK